MMKKLMVVMLAFGLAGCADFVDEDGNTSIRQVARGLKSVGDKVAEMGEALERDADVEAVPWDRLIETIPDELEGASRRDTDGDDATDRNGAGMSIATAHYLIEGDSAFVGVADLGALRSGVHLALRWVAPLFADDELDGNIEEIEVGGYPAIRIRSDDRDHYGVFIALIAEGRFAVAAGAEGPDAESLVRAALEEVDYRRLEDWVDYGRD